MIDTVGDLINFTLRAANILGVGQTARAEDVFGGLDLLRMIVAQWQRKRWLTYVEQEVSVAETSGAQFYTIGPGGDFNTGARVVRISAAYMRLIPGVPPNLVDIPLEVFESREDYARISVKALTTMPAAVWLETGYPLGKVWVWPVPVAAMYGLYLVVQSPLPSYTALTDPLLLPEEYQEALVWTLAVRMQMAYGLPPSSGMVAAAKMAMNTLRQANTQIPQLQVPAPVGRIRDDLSLVGHGLGRAFILDQGAVI